MAGFLHVVGCLWPSKDRVYVEVASRFYASPFGQEKLRWENGEMAAALREVAIAARCEMTINNTAEY